MDLMVDRDSPFVVVKFENLISGDHEEFTKILQFLFSDDYYESKAQLFGDRIHCIFPELLRSDYGRLGAMHRAAANVSVHLTFDVAYQWLVDHRPDVLCRAWSTIELFARQ